MKKNVYEKSSKHHIHISTMKQRGIILEKIDQQLTHQMKFENNY